jgi:hypothetical protein
MRRPRVRITIRHMMVLVAVVAFGLAVAEEFRDGIPPRFVVRGIPKRIDRLWPGMSWEQAREILGLEQTWLTGGTGARFAVGDGNGRSMHEVYYVRPPRLVVRMARVAGGNPAPVTVQQPTAMIQLWFRRDVRSGTKDWRRDKSTRLVRASFSVDSGTIAEMPGSP